MRKRATQHQVSVERKAAALRKHFGQGVPAPDVCAEFGIPISTFYAWRRRVLNNLEVLLARRRPARRK